MPHLDTETRGLISETIDRISEQNFLQTINWVLEADDPTASREDLALGYFIGATMNIATGIVRHRKMMKLQEILKKSLVKIGGKGRPNETLGEMGGILEVRATKDGGLSEIELTKEETEEVKSMIVPVISSFRKKIQSEEALRKTS